MPKINLFLEQKYLGSAGGIDGLLEENAILEQELELLQQDTVSNQYWILLVNWPFRDKTCLRGFRQSEIQTSLLSYRH